MRFITHLLTCSVIGFAISAVSCSVSDARADVREREIIVIPVAALPEAPSQCPPEMIEVDGNYCPNVEEHCLEWDEKVVNANGKVRCLRFGPSKCLSPKLTHLHYCIDKFEYQKDKTDPLPTVMVSFNEMQVLAKKENKRLCFDYEWTFACMGEELRPYANGWTREPSKCNIDKPWIPFDEAKLGNPKTRDEEVKRLSQREPIDGNPECLSPFGVYGMVGNVDELLINTNSSVGHKNTLKGGHWAIGARNRCSPRTDAHNEGFAFYEVGARLCKDIK